MPARVELRALAERLGILDGHRGADGSWHAASDASRAALCAALGHPAASEAEARRSLEALTARDRARLLPGDEIARAARGIVLRPRHAEAAHFEWCATDERGRRSSGGGRAAPRRGRLAIRLPRLALGAHRLWLRVSSPSGAREIDQTLWVVPACCPSPPARAGARRAFGLWANLYTVRSSRGLGVGHFGDLRELVELAADAGADFLGLSPLHALRNRGAEISPYSPVSRLFRNPLMLDVEAIPELATSAPARRLLARRAFREALAAARASPTIDYDGSTRLASALIPLLHDEFRERASSARRSAFERYRAAQGALLEDYATFAALEERLAAEGRPRDWRAWPAALRDAGSREVRAFRARHARSVERHAYVQFELDRQLAQASRAARRAGLRIGLYTDLAFGSAPSGFDAWRFRDLFVEDVEVGAPPDLYNPAGQAWGFPPLHPQRLREGGLGFVARMLRANLASAGALRIDHVLGFFRQWCVPDPSKPAQGAYVRFPTRALLGILALEARRAGALIIGEDLGTVPPEVPPTLARHGVLSSRVLLFERDRAGRFRPASAYSKRALVTANTHDLPPLGGYFSGRDLELRRSLGLVGARDHARALRERARECSALLARLRRSGHLAKDSREPSRAERLRAVNRFLYTTPAPLVGVALDDLAFETEPVNLPGVAADRHPCWRRRMSVPISEIASSAEARLALPRASVRRRRPRP